MTFGFHRETKNLDDIAIYHHRMESYEEMEKSLFRPEQKVKRYTSFKVIRHFLGVKGYGKL